MNPEKLTEKQKETWGKPIKGSRYIRDFCAECKEPIRVPSEKLLNDNYCNFCDSNPLPRRTICDLNHLAKSVGEVDIDSGYDFQDNSYPQNVDINEFDCEL